ncbi:MAG: pirin family protein, partial [Actinomycetota bacterium]|nr:pirin family protein [Actinomycetota bacterium]
PHRGFETVTYIIDGTFAHRDSHGGGGLITNGATQWMTAGAGILHIERPPEELVVAGGLFHGIQLWVNLPAADKWLSPGYQSIEADEVALLTTPDAGALIRVIAGDIGAKRGPGSTHTPITLAHVTVHRGAQMALPWDASFNALIYVLAGRGVVGPNRTAVQTGQLAAFGAGGSLIAEADRHQDANAPDLELLILGGQPIREPVATYGPFVMNTRAELAEAFEDFQRGKMGSIPANA